MAELVNRRVEEMISELEQMQRIDLYTAEEIREIARKRKEFEYKIQRQQKSKEDYLRYISYESALLEDISLRREHTRITEKQHEIEYAIAKRLNKLYKQLIFRFQSDINVWLEYIKFCKNVNFITAVSQIIGAMLQVHGDKPKAWHLACMWECYETGNVSIAKKFLIKGLHRHPQSTLLYREALRLELLGTKKLNETDLENQVKRIEIICKNALANVSDVKFHIEVCNLLKSFEAAVPIMERIFSVLWADNKDELDVWEFVANCELNGIHFKDVVAMDDVSLPVDVSEAVKKSVAVYEGALAKFENEEATSSFLKFLLSLKQNQCSQYCTLELIKMALKTGHDDGLLTEDWYKLWIPLLTMQEISSTDIDQVLDDAIAKSPTYKYLWEMKIKRTKGDSSNIINILADAKKHFKSDDILFLWELILDNTNDLNTLKSLYLDSQLLPVKTSVPLRSLFLRKIHENGDLKSARKIYVQMLNIPPMCIDVHRTMLEIELKQDTPNLKFCRKCHGHATQQFGESDPQVWLDYIEFETTKGSPQLAGQIHARAVACLKRETVDQFIKMYALKRIK